VRWAVAKGLIALLTLLLGLVPTAVAAGFSRVPRVRGETVAKAERTIRRHHLRVGKVSYQLTVNVRSGRVIGTVPKAGRRVRAGTKVRIAVARRPVRPPATALPPTTPVPVAGPGLPMIGIANVPGCLTGADPTPYIRLYGAKVMRVVVSRDWGANGEALPCVRAAIVDGVKLHLDLQYYNNWTVAQDAAFARQVLGYYGPYVWAVSVGNEQELGIDAKPQTPAQYAATWRALVPVIRSAAPQAILIAGEISPWGEGFLKAAYADGLPGVQAIAAHAYRSPFCFSIPELESWSAAHRLPLWFTEGLRGPDAWGTWGGFDLTLQQMAGAAVADVWLVG
jgi:PASTA domain